MNKIFYGIVTIALSLSSTVIAAQSTQALEEGLYWGGGSRYISIFKQTNSTGDRFCYMGASPNGMMITSLTLKIPRYQTGIDYEVYTLHRSNNLAIQQYAFKPDQITFGKLVGRFVREGLVYKRDGDLSTERSPDLQECLNSSKPYFKQTLSSRDRR